MDAYRTAVSELTSGMLSTHYSDGLRYFHDEFVPQLKERLTHLTGGAWDLSDFVAYAAGSDVDFMTHLVEAVAARGAVALYPGDWHGFRVGSTHQERIRWDATGRAELACLCIPSVRNGHLTDEMLPFLANADACLLNLNLFPTLEREERRTIALALREVLPKSILSISFSRGFGLTASQLGVALVPRNHPMRSWLSAQWDWLTYFHNALAARAFLAIEPAHLEAVDQARRESAGAWLSQRGLPVVSTGSYYVKSFRLDDPVPDRLRPLARGDVVRLCLKPTDIG